LHYGVQISESNNASAVCRVDWHYALYAAEVGILSWVSMLPQPVTAKRTGTQGHTR